VFSLFKGLGRRVRLSISVIPLGVLIGLQGGCVVGTTNLAVEPKQTSSLPAWVQQPESDSSSALWGIGSGPDLETSKKNALTDIAGKFNTRVQESIEQLYRVDNDDVQELLRIANSSQVAATELSDFQVTRSQKVDDTVWVEVRLDKPAYGKRLSGNYVTERNKLKDSMERFDGLSTLEQLLQIDALKEHVNRLGVVGAQVNFVNPDPGMAEDAGQYADYLKTLLAVKDKHKVILVSQDTPEQFTSLINEKLGLAGIKIAEGKGGGENNAAIRLLSRTDSYQDDRDAYIFKIEMDVTSVDEKGVILGKATHRAQGRSYDSYNDAQSKAVSSLNYSLGKKSLASLLKLSD